jgi:hypothetical protein
MDNTRRAIPQCESADFMVENPIIFNKTTKSAWELLAD